MGEVQMWCSIVPVFRQGECPGLCEVSLFHSELEADNLEV